MAGAPSSTFPGPAAADRERERLAVSRDVDAGHPEKLALALLHVERDRQPLYTVGICGLVSFVFGAAGWARSPARQAQ